MRDATCLVCMTSRVDAELRFENMRWFVHLLTVGLRPHGRWLPEIPKAARRNPRTVRKDYMLFLAVQDAFYDAMSRPHPHLPLEQ